MISYPTNYSTISISEQFFYMKVVLLNTQLKMWPFFNPPNQLHTFWDVITLFAALCNEGGEVIRPLRPSFSRPCQFHADNISSQQKEEKKPLLFSFVQKNYILTSMLFMIQYRTVSIFNITSYYCMYYILYQLRFRLVKHLKMTF